MGQCGLHWVEKHSSNLRNKMLVGSEKITLMEERFLTCSKIHLDALCMIVVV